MANWKEMGEVPDSDDEGDSQSGGSNSGAQDEAKSEGKEKNEQHAEVRNGIHVGVEQQNSFICRETKQRTLGIPWLSLSQSPPPTVFTGPPRLDDIEDLGSSRISVGPDQDHMDDEVSTCHIALSSPLSSLHESQNSSPLSKKHIRLYGNERKSTGEEEDETVEDKYGYIAGDLEDSIIADLPEYLSMEERTFRPRNPIQLRPYALEGAKYRSTLIARGMKPLRLAQMREDSRRNTQAEEPSPPRFDSEDDSHNLFPNQWLMSSSAPSSQTSVILSQPDFPQLSKARADIVEEAGDDGFATSPRFPELCNPIQDELKDIELAAYPQLLDQRCSKMEEEDDEEFPDVERLIRQNYQNKEFVRLGQKRQKMNKYGSRSRHLPPHPSLDRNGPHNHRRSQRDIFDMPASPPETSPRLPKFDSRSSEQEKRLPRPDLAMTCESSTEKRTSREGTPLRIFPTPATSAMKGHVGSVNIESDYEGSLDRMTIESSINRFVEPMTIESDNEDLFASESSSHLDSTQEPDDFPEIQRVANKIRGVLPASWLRLDSHARQVKALPPVCVRNSQSLSPVKPRSTLSRKGVAVPRVSSSNKGASRVTSASTSYFKLDNDSGDEEDPTQRGSNSFNQASKMEVDNKFSFLEPGDIFEDDRIDAMLPSQKRSSRLFPATRKKKKSHMRSLFNRQQDGTTRQPKIADQYCRASSKCFKPTERMQKFGKKQKTRSRPAGRLSNNTSITPLQIAPPRLSILDMIDPIDSWECLPQFIRIAARNARSKREVGRHSPTHKYIRLGNREDTEEAQAVLRNWREGTIPQRADIPSLRHTAQDLVPLKVLSSNYLNQTYHPLNSKPREGNLSRCSSSPRTPLLGKPKQTRLEWTSAPRPPLIKSFTSHELGKKVQAPVSMNRKFPPRSHVMRLFGRRAQLETSVGEHTLRHPSLAFGSSKKALDAIYRREHRRSGIRGDVQLARFLHTGDSNSQALRSSTRSRNGEMNLDTNQTVRARPGRNRKQAPQRVDAGAEKYRQPSEPLILDFFQAQKTGSEADNMAQHKLIGLGSYGSTYTYHFDMLPLPSEAFFHESTFIGSGRLSKALSMSRIESFAGRGQIAYKFADRELRWGVWNEAVSSELGICFDWFVEQLDATHAASTLHSDHNVLSCMTFIVDYVHSHLAFEDCATRMESVSRFLTLLISLTDRLEYWANRFGDGDIAQCQSVVKITTLQFVLLFQLLRGLFSEDLDPTLRQQFESLLRRTVGVVVKLLLVIGLDPLRNFYDNLQYLAVRERGIDVKHHVVESWIIVILVMGAVNIPRLSFWDVFNTEIKLDQASTITDARQFEKLWRSMYLLIPLCEFNQMGKVVPGSRGSKSFENWTLPQHISKRIFELYTSNSRQAPSFNEYCRTLFRRCHHLIQDWGWRRHGSMIGTFFDFFAIQKLAHFRNEETYKSPPFLEHLHQTPNLAPEQDDNCFHIFLKTIALSIRQLREADDTKAIRNLVTRLLPNHDRRYPKDEVVQKRDLASLRNHHDLICTLFWSAPPTLRPSINLLRDLVDPSGDHREAYLIHLQAWSNLALFVLSSSPTIASYQPLADWEQNSFLQLVNQHDSVDADVAEQLHRLPSLKTTCISQHDIEQVARRNKDQVVTLQLIHLRHLKHVMEQFQFVGGMQSTFPFFVSDTAIKKPAVILALLQCLNKVTLSDSDIDLAWTSLDVIETYLDRLQDFLPMMVFSTAVDEEDSQDYGGPAAMRSMLALDFIKFLDNDLLSNCCDVVRNVIKNHPLRKQIATSKSKDSSEKLVSSWAHIVCLLCEDASQYTLSDFVAGGKFNAFDLKDELPSVNKWNFFFQARYVLLDDSIVIRGNKLLTTGQDPLWGLLNLLVLPEPQCLQDLGVILFHSYLTSEPLLEDLYTPNYRGAEHLRMHRGMVQFANTNPEGSLIALGVEKDKNMVAERAGETDLEDCGFCLTFIEVIFRRMALHVDFQQTLTISEPLRGRFRDVILLLHNVMKQELRALPPTGQIFRDYQDFCWKVAKLMDIYFPVLCNHFPAEYKVADSSSVELHEQLNQLKLYGKRAITSQGRQRLSFLCMYILKTMASDRDKDAFFRLFRSGMGSAWNEVEDSVTRKTIYLLHGEDCSTKHILTEVVPAFVHAAFFSASGFYGAVQFLKIAAWHINRMVQHGEETLALKYALPTLRIITFHIVMAADNVQFDEGDPISIHTQRLLPIITKFYKEIYMAMMLISRGDDDPDKFETFAQLELFRLLVKGVKRYHSTEFKPELWLLDPREQDVTIDRGSVLPLIERYNSIPGSHRRASTAKEAAFLAIAAYYVDTNNEWELDRFENALGLDFGDYIYDVLRSFIRDSMETMLDESKDVDRAVRKFVPRLLEHQTASGIPSFGGAIIQDLRDNWKFDPDPFELQIKIGREWYAVAVDSGSSIEWQNAMMSDIKDLEEYHRILVLQPDRTLRDLVVFDRLNMEGSSRVAKIRNQQPESFNRSMECFRVWDETE